MLEVVGVIILLEGILILWGVDLVILSVFTSWVGLLGDRISLLSSLS